MTGTSTNPPPAETRLQCRHHLVHCDTANATTENMTLDAQFKLVCRTSSSENEKRHAIRCEYGCIALACCQLKLYHTAGVRRDLRDQSIAALNGKHPWSTTACVCTVREIELPDVVICGIFTDEFLYENPREWTEQALITLEHATEAYMVEVIAESDM